MDFSLTPAQSMLQRLARKFAREEVAPVARELDHLPNPADCMPWDLVRKMDKIGLRQMNVPKEFGGPGIQDYVSACIVAEELAVADLGVAAFSMCNRAIVHFLTCKELATQEQLERFLPAFVNDEVSMIAVAFTEPDHGSENMLPYEEPEIGIQLQAVPQGDYWILNGTKHFISAGGFAKLYFIYARTDPTVGPMNGTSMFAVPHDTPGFRIGVIHDKMGLRLHPNGELIFENARVPKENLLGPVNQARKIVMQVVEPLDYIINGARCVGVARGCYEAALEHARARVQGGKPIIEHDLVAVKLVDMYAWIGAARAFVWQAAWAADNRERQPEYAQLADAATLNAHEMVTKVAINALEIFGGYGIMRDHPIEKMVRDALCMEHAKGGMNIRRLHLKSLLQQ